MSCPTKLQSMRRTEDSLVATLGSSTITLPEAALAYDSESNIYGSLSILLFIHACLKTYLVNLVSVGTLNLDRVGRQFSVKIKGVVQVFGNELRVDLPLGVETKQGSNGRLHIAEAILLVWICRVNKVQNKRAKTYRRR